MEQSQIIQLWGDDEKTIKQYPVTTSGVVTHGNNTVDNEIENLKNKQEKNLDNLEKLNEAIRNLPDAQQVTVKVAELDVQTGLLQEMLEDQDATITDIINDGDKIKKDIEMLMLLNAPYEMREPIALGNTIFNKALVKEGNKIVEVVRDGWSIDRLTPDKYNFGDTAFLKMVDNSGASLMVEGTIAFAVERTIKDKQGNVLRVVVESIYISSDSEVPISGYLKKVLAQKDDTILVCHPSSVTSILIGRNGTDASAATTEYNLREELNKKTDFEGMYELLTAGYSLNMVGKGIGEPQAFMSRKTGGGNITDGAAVIKEVNGVQPIVWNQLVDRNVTPIALSDSSVSENGDEITINTTVPFGGCKVMLGNSIIMGHKYFISVYAKSNKRAVFSSDNGGISISVSSTYETLYRIATPIEQDDKNYLFIWNIANEENTITYKKSSLRFTDLTQMFGAGNEPSTYEEYLERISHYNITDPYAFNNGEIVNYKGTGIKTTGRNLWDEQWRLGVYHGKVGEKISWATDNVHVSNVNPIKVIGGKSYFFYGRTQFGYGIRFVDANDNVLLVDYPTKSIVTAPLNAVALYFAMDSSYGTTYSHDICINISDTSFNGQYEPHKSYIRDWSEVMEKYFPDGMTNLNGVKDFFNDKKAVRRFGVKVFDGTENWFYRTADSSDNKYHFLRNFFNKKYSAYIKPAPFFMNAYQTVASNTPNKNKMCFSCEIETVYDLAIADSAFTSAAAWKSHLAQLYTAGTPLKVYYELAEPVEDEFDKPLNLAYTVLNGGTETSIAAENSTQFEGNIAYNKDYVAVVDELQLQNRVTEVEFDNWEN